MDLEAQDEEREKVRDSVCAQDAVERFARLYAELLRAIGECADEEVHAGTSPQRIAVQLRECRDRVSGAFVEVCGTSRALVETMDEPEEADEKELERLRARRDELWRDVRQVDEELAGKIDELKELQMMLQLFSSLTLPDPRRAFTSLDGDQAKGSGVGGDNGAARASTTTSSAASSVGIS
eukprot:TRINITY_DN7810_c0_g1_i2.p1 TRINITY_DN7810_c0_g1~~TRINITY_DN7810_c0_g1_i2.p1  ORF type:complete len:181 (+),score=37.56 TRINITY_DN7810_c0_g1_i2:177-719(+)